MSKFQTVLVDNWARDYNGGKSETLLGTFEKEGEAKRLADEWNEKNNFGGNGADYAIVRDGDHPVYVFDGY